MTTEFEQAFLRTHHKIVLCYLSFGKILLKLLCYLAPTNKVKKIMSLFEEGRHTQTHGTGTYTCNSTISAVQI